MTASTGWGSDNMGLTDGTGMYVMDVPIAGTSRGPAPAARTGRVRRRPQSKIAVAIPCAELAVGHGGLSAFASVRGWLLVTLAGSVATVAPLVPPVTRAISAVRFKVPRN